MPLLVALSAYQSRPRCEALSALVPHIDSGRIDGVQLTPGNLPSPDFAAAIQRIERCGVMVRRHHGYSSTHYRRSVYTPDGRPVDIGREHSVHPPRDVEWEDRCGTSPDDARGIRRSSARTGRPPAVSARWSEWLSIALEHDLLVETMYPGYLLGSAAQLNDAMDAELRLCVDIAHLAIQDEAGVLDRATLERLLGYHRIEEVHVSHSRRGRDTHSPLEVDTPWLGWARSHIGRVPVVVESYWHHVSVTDQVRQLNLVRGPSPTSSLRDRCGSSR